jgi:Holliday junction resolvasome RuvABC ATP-dependent DNA helicase subunit
MRVRARADGIRGTAMWGVERMRPQTLDDYVGQEHLIGPNGVIRKAIQAGRIPSMILWGPPGVGKTTLAHLIANHLKRPFHVLSAISSGVKDVREVIQKAEGAGMFSQAGAILFIDEIHGLPRDTVEIIYAMMEDFRCDGQRISPFTLIGATTEYGELLKDRRPFVDRFKLNFELASYSVNEMVQLINKYVERKNYDIDEVSMGIIAKNCKLVPRTAIRLADATDTLGDVMQAVYSYNIVKDGLTEKDIKTLEYLNMNKKAGINSISAYLNTPIQSYRYEIEPYLLQMGYVLVIPGGRQITPLGKQFLGSLKA